jgi:hypothetical protein
MNNEVVKVFQEWFDEERGNRVTSNNMEALVRKVMVVVQALTEPQEVPNEQNSGIAS